MISDFTYLKPGSMKEALQMLAEHQDECKVICGGQSLLVIMRQGLTYLRSTSSTSKGSKRRIT